MLLSSGVHLGGHGVCGTRSNDSYAIAKVELPDSHPQWGAASTAYPMTKMQGNARLPIVHAELLSVRYPAFPASERLEVDLIRHVIFKHLERNLAPQRPISADFAMLAAKSLICLVERHLNLP